MAGNRIDSIQHLRGIAAIFVIVIHCSAMMRYPQYFGQFPFDPYGFGNFRTAIFFAISGFIHVLVCLDADGRPKIGVADFFWRRAIRILPMLWILVVLYNGVSWAATGKMEWPEFIRSIVLFWPSGDLKPNILWTLRHELYFYIIFSLAFLGSRPIRSIAVAWFVAPIAICVLRYLSPDLFVAMGSDANEIINRTISEGSGANLQFGCGVALGFMWIKTLRSKAIAIPGGFVTVLLVVLVGAYILSFGPYRRELDLASVLIHAALAFSVVLVSAMVVSGNQLMDRIGMILGDSSYCIYLFHTLFILILLEATSKFGLNQLPVSGIAYLIFFTVSTVIGGVFVHYLIEVPLVRRLLRQLPLTAKKPVATNG